MILSDGAPESSIENLDWDVLRSVREIEYCRYERTEVMVPNVISS